MTASYPPPREIFISLSTSGEELRQSGGGEFEVASGGPTTRPTESTGVDRRQFPGAAATAFLSGESSPSLGAGCPRRDLVVWNFRSRGSASGSVVKEPLVSHKPPATPLPPTIDPLPPAAPRI